MIEGTYNMRKKTTFLATGDSFITRRLPVGGYTGFREIKEVIAAHEVRFNNLEITIHNKEGYPAAFSGGTWAMAEPGILDDLKQFGFNLYNTANNHSGDYSHGGLLATIRHLRERDMLYAGTGENLAAASAPAYLETSCARVAMLGVCATFHDSDAAGNQGPALQGRPGLNPLRYQKTFHVEPRYYETLREIARKTEMNASMELTVQNGYARLLPEGKLYFGGMNFCLSDENALYTEPLQTDMERITAHIREARRQADYVLVSVHSHEFSGRSVVNPAQFLRTFAHTCIDAGADAILGHGPHELRGVEIYNGKAIFYSLGNFIFQTETVSMQPADAYENAAMSSAAMVGEYMDRRSRNGTSGYAVQPNIWRSVMAGFTAENGVITEIKFYPITLGMELPRSRIGFPQLLHSDEVLEYLAELSRPFGTKMQIANGVASVML